MKNKKLLYVLIPIVVVVLALIVGVVYMVLSVSPEKIFKTTINSVFNAFEKSEEQLSTLKGTMKLTASVETDNEQMQEINTILEGTSINLDMQVDTDNMAINQNLNLIVNNESLLNAAIILQDQKGYVYLKDYLDKYLEIPQENMGYSDLTEYYDKITTLDQNSLMQAINEELVVTISAQELMQEDTTLILDGHETKVTASILDLQGQEIITFTKYFLTKLKTNEKFQTSLGDFKEDVMALLDDMLADESEASDDMHFIVTIYTKGFMNKIIGTSLKSINNVYDKEIGFEILKHNNGKYGFVAYNEYKGDREDVFSVTVEEVKENKNKGIATIAITVEEEQFVVTYSYEKQGKQTSFILSTEIEGVGISFSGNAVETGKNIKGTFIILVQEETFGKVNLNCDFDFTYDVEIQKANVENADLIDELSEEDIETLMTNLLSSSLYQLIGQNEGFGFETSNSNVQPEVTYNGFTVQYNVPENFEESEYGEEEYKMYMDENFNSINVTIKQDSVDTYMNDLDEAYVLTSDFYENQKISDEKSLNINGKEYKLRTITYNDEYDSYVDLYFAYELDKEHCYVIEVESEGGKIAMDTIKYFLDVIVIQEESTFIEEETEGEELIDFS